ncbi:MAG: hypothetical protein IKS28_06700 [Clostridia bacterium]|nr:hypothetical protein [Clostridia bacterium]
MEEKQGPQIFDTATFESVGTDENGEIKASDRPSGAGTYIASPSGGFVLQGSAKVPEPAQESEKSKKGKRKKSRTVLAPDSDSGERREAKKKTPSARMEKIKDDDENIFRENRYFSEISKKYSALKIISMILAGVYVAAMLVIFNSGGTQALTVNGFQYLLKDLDFSSLNQGVFETMVYSGGSDADFASYRGDLVVVTSGLTTLFKTTGATAFTSENDYYSPKLLTSSKYFLVYDTGNTSYGYSVYNSFAALVSEHLNYPITSAALADNGSYAIVSRDDSYRTVIYVYDYNLKKLLEVKKEKYTSAVDMSDDGKKLYIASFFDTEGDFSCEISCINTATGEETLNISVDSEIPMQVKELDGGNVAVMFRDKIVVYGSDGVKYSEITPTLSSQVFGYIGRDIICMTNNSAIVGDEKDVRIFDTNGRTLYSGVHSGEELKVFAYEGNVYILFQDRVLKIDPATGKCYNAPVQPNAIDIVFTTSGYPYVCFSGSALPLTFEEE